MWLPYMILPIYAGLERDPSSLLEASADLGGARGTTFRRVVLPLVFPAVVAGSIFTFSLTLGDYIIPDLVSDAKFIGNVIYDNSALGNCPVAAAYSMVPIVIMLVVPARRPAAGRVRVPVRAARDGRVRLESAFGLRVATGSCSAFLYIPLLVLAINAFNASCSQAWPPPASACTGSARRSPTPPSACVDELDPGGARSRDDRAGAGHAGGAGRPALRVLRRDTINFLLVLPIALPGVVTGIALSTTFQTSASTFGLSTIIIGHATFCVVIAYNNVVARLRRCRGPGGGIGRHGR